MLMAGEFVLLHASSRFFSAVAWLVVLLLAEVWHVRLKGWLPNLRFVLGSFIMRILHSDIEKGCNTSSQKAERPTVDKNKTPEIRPCAPHTTVIYRVGCSVVWILCGTRDSELLIFRGF